MANIAVVPKVTVPNDLKEKWETSMMNSRMRTAKIVIYGRRHFSRDDLASAICKVIDKEKIESVYCTNTNKEVFVTLKNMETYIHFLSLKVNIGPATFTPVAYDSCDVEARLHWVKEEIPDEMIAFFLEEHCEEVSKITHETDVNGVKTGVRIATIRLMKEQKPSFPHVLLMTPNNPVLITVPGRRPLCLKCHHIGHVRSNCDTPFCRHCKMFGHHTELCHPTYADAINNQPHPIPVDQSSDSEKETTAEDEDDVFDKCEEALAANTQEWKEIRRKGKKRKKKNTTKNNPPPVQQSSTPDPTPSVSMPTSARTPSPTPDFTDPPEPPENHSSTSLSDTDQSSTGTEPPTIRPNPKQKTNQNT